MKLEEIKGNSLISGIIPDQPVQIVSLEWIGQEALTVVYRDSEGAIHETNIYREDEQNLKLEKSGRTWSFDADGDLVRMTTEANRIKLAHHFDPYLALHTSMVDPLPHQITAVYGEMLSRQPLRFLLADDPGAGKTIMSGLLIKELMARGDLERCLVVAPGGLVEQWQDELWEKFNLKFDIFSKEMVETIQSGNPFDEKNFLIARLDMLARNEDHLSKLSKSQEWDLIICDEAHRMSASFWGGDVKKTKRYQLGQELGHFCRHFLLMTATPHNGKEEDFQLFMALLDGDRFEGSYRDGTHYAETDDLMRRLTKEELLKFNGQPLFPERKAYTVRYELSEKEAALYSAVTEYVRDEMNRVQRFADIDNQKRVNVGFALQILQRRLASSPAAIFNSLKRRKERLKNELGEAKLAAKGKKVRFGVKPAFINNDLFENLDEYAQDEIEDYEEVVSTRATTAETIDQLEQEIETLKLLEKMALSVLRSGEDTKWNQLSKILDDELMVDSEGNRRKLIIFTEPKDTLLYLAEKIQSRLGKPEAVEVIHGGVKREERKKAIERFMQDKDLLVLVANDAAGEGVNLQRGHLMVNYDLPWNPNKIEQRFGRIHRIGQTEVCHLWNLVAADTREGAVYARLLEKMETARGALKNRVFDVLGELFEGNSLRDLLWEAIQYGEREDVKAKLFEKIDNAVDYEHINSLVDKRKLTNDILPPNQVDQLKIDMERAEALRLQPHHIQSFFIEAFKHLGGQIKPRGKGRFEIKHVPVRIRERDRQIGIGAPVQKKYERICFEKDYINKQPVAAYVCPGHPLLEAVISLIREKYGHLLKLGAVMVDESDENVDVKTVFLLEHSVQDGRKARFGGQQIISEKMQFASIDKKGNVLNAGIAPHLNLRAAAKKEMKMVEDVLGEDWLCSNLESEVTKFATVNMAQSHLKEVKERRLPEIEKAEKEVQARLKQEIRYWDARALELKEMEKLGKKTRLSSENAARRAEDLTERLNRRMKVLSQQKHISSSPPKIRGGMVIIPIGLLEQRKAQEKPAKIAELAQNAEARRESELLAMDAVFEAEKALGNKAKDVSEQNIGYDIESYDPKNNRLRFIEVKGRVEGAKTVTVTRNEIITSLHKPDAYILAVVSIEDGEAKDPRYIKNPFQVEPDFHVTAQQVQINKLLKLSEAPQ